MKTLAVAVAVCLVLALTSFADARQGKRHARHAKAPVHPTMMLGQGPAHMVEVRPGLWISSYGCITDEGYGRFSPCDLTDKSR